MSIVGKTIGRYRVIEQLGQGGMAVVYKAYDTRLQRDVAVKLIRTETIPPVQLERLLKRFEREAKAQAQFEHPNIVPIYDYGEYKGSPFLVMAYRPGGTLKGQITGRMLYSKAASLLSPIADALAYAHRRDVLHRDVKPSNILMGEEDTPSLTDFGIAKLLGEVEEATLTGTGLGVGTPQYMAPEQWTGKPVPQTDIYALGVVFYELLTGRRPYDADTPAAIILQQANEPLLRPAALAPDLPEHVEKVLYKALAKEPEDRYASMAEFGKVLEELGQEAPAVTETQPALLEDGEGETPSMPIDDKDETVDELAPVVDGRKEKLGSPAWVWVVAAGVILFGVLLAGVMTGRKGFGPLARLAADTPTATSSPTATIAPTITRTSTATPAPSSTARPTSTPDPRTLGESLELCGTGLCLVSDLKREVIPLNSIYTDYYSFSLSPDGSNIVFGGCLKENILANPDRGCYNDLYVGDREGNNIEMIDGDPNFHFKNPSWSPDGSWIAYEASCSLAKIKPDGSSKQTLLTHSSIACPWAIAWSPDNQKIAWVGGWSGGPGGGYTADVVGLMDANGNNMKFIYIASGAQLETEIAWSPDGKFVAIELLNSKAYLIDVDCEGGLEGCDESSRTEISDIPKHWLHTYYPQWLGEEIDGEIVIIQPTMTPTPVVLENGSRVIAGQVDADMEIVRIDPDGTQTILTNNNAFDGHVAVSPSGTKIAFWSDREGRSEVYIMDVDGRNVEKISSGGTNYDPSWFSDGRSLFYVAQKRSSSQIKTYNLITKETSTLVSFPYSISVPELAADEKSIVYIRTESGQPWWAGDMYQFFIESGDVVKLEQGLMMKGQYQFPWETFFMYLSHYDQGQ